MALGQESPGLGIGLTFCRFSLQVFWLEEGGESSQGHGAMSPQAQAGLLWALWLQAEGGGGSLSSGPLVGLSPHPLLAPPLVRSFVHSLRHLLLQRWDTDFALSRLDYLDTWRHYFVLKGNSRDFFGGPVAKIVRSHFSGVRLCVTPEMAAHQPPPSLELSRQEHWSGLPFPSPMHESEK